MATASVAGVSHDVIVALQAENDAISHTHDSVEQLHPLHEFGSDHTAVHKSHPPESHDINQSHTPAHPPATPSTEKTIAIVTEQVKQMNCR